MTGTKFDLEIFMEEYFALLTVLREITKETIAAGIWKKLETLYMTKSLANRLYLKKKLYTFQMHPGKSQSEHIDEFPQKTRAGRTLEDDRSKKGDGVEGFMEGETGRKGYKGMISIVYNHKKSQGFVRIEDQESGYGADGYDSVDGMRIQRTGKVQIQMRDGSSFVLDNVRYVSELRRNLISLGILKKEGFIVKMQSVKIKVIKGSLVVLSGTRRANCVYTLDGQAVTRKTLKGRKQLGEYLGGRSRRVMFLDFCNQRSTQQCTKSGVTKHLGVVVIQQKWVGYEMNVTLLAKVVLYRNMGFNESGEYKKTFIGSGVGTGSVQVLQGVEFKVEPQEDHTFEVEPHGNVDHVAVHMNYREDNNEAAFAVAEAEKIYAHESLTFNNTVACEVISNDVYDWVYTTRTEIWPTKGLLDRANGMYMVWRSSGSEWNTLWVTQSSYTGSWYRLCWKDTLYCLLREYQMVCTRLDIASADVDQVPWVDHHKLRVDDNKYVEEARSYDAAHDGLSLQLKRGALSKDIPVAKVQHRFVATMMTTRADYLEMVQKVACSFMLCDLDFEPLSLSLSSLPSCDLVSLTNMLILLHYLESFKSE
ncbi:hypothetical protein Tco_1092616 [Tanacetum coccineum]|uniref:Retrovirus-related Pol polyprotein from transposon TNT 1-94-like beta-barrel domain-containing protein n=1 Tax=Tanacetum coccineum TaxID=301880 RepID=A0ABQ5IAB9_9ASTR